MERSGEASAAAAQAATVGGGTAARSSSGAVPPRTPPVASGTASRPASARAGADAAVAARAPSDAGVRSSSVLRWFSGSGSGSGSGIGGSSSTRLGGASSNSSRRGGSGSSRRASRGGAGWGDGPPPSARGAAGAKVAAEQLQAGAALLFQRTYASEVCVQCGYAHGVRRPCCETYVCNVCYYGGLGALPPAGDAPAADDAEWLTGLACPHCHAEIADFLDVEALRPRRASPCQRRACAASIGVAALIVLLAAVGATQWQRASRFVASALAASGLGQRTTDASWFGRVCAAGGGPAARACFNASAFTQRDGQHRLFDTVRSCAGPGVGDLPPDYWRGSAALAATLPDALAGTDDATCLCAATCVTQPCVVSDSGGALGWDIVGSPDDGSAPSWRVVFDGFSSPAPGGAPMLDGTPAVAPPQGGGGGGPPVTLGHLWAATEGATHETGCGASELDGEPGDTLALKFGGDSPRSVTTAPLDTRTGGLWSFDLVYGSGTPTCPAAAYGTVVLESAPDADACVFDLTALLHAVAAAGVSDNTTLEWDGVGRLRGVTAVQPLPATLGTLRAAVVARALRPLSTRALLSDALPFLRQPLALPTLSPFLDATTDAVSEMLLYAALAEDGSGLPLITTNWSDVGVAEALAAGASDGVSPMILTAPNATVCRQAAPTLCVSTLATVVVPRVPTASHVATLPWRRVAAFPIPAFRAAPGVLTRTSVVLPPTARGECMRFRWRQPLYWAAVDAWALDSVEYVRAARAAPTAARAQAADAAALAACCSGCVPCLPAQAARCGSLLVALGAARNGSDGGNASAASYALRTRLVYEDTATVLVLIAALVSVARLTAGVVSLAAACLIPVRIRRRACQALCLDAPMAVLYIAPAAVIATRRSTAVCWRAVCRTPTPVRVAPEPSSGASLTPASPPTEGVGARPLTAAAKTPRVPRTPAKQVSQAALFAMTAVVEPVPTEPATRVGSRVATRRGSFALPLPRRSSAALVASPLSLPGALPSALVPAPDELAELHKAIAYTTAIVAGASKAAARTAAAALGAAASGLSDAVAAVQAEVQAGAEADAAAAAAAAAASAAVAAADEAARRAADDHRKRCLARALDDSVPYPGAVLGGSGAAVVAAIVVVTAAAVGGIVAPALAGAALLAASSGAVGVPLPGLASIHVPAAAAAVAAAMSPDAGPRMRTFPRNDPDYAGPTAPPDEGVFSSHWVLVAALAVDAAAVARLLVHGAGGGARAVATCASCRALTTRAAGRVPAGKARVHVASARTDLYVALSDAVLQAAAGGARGGAGPLRLASLRNVTYRPAWTVYAPWIAACAVSALPFASIAIANAASPAVGGGPDRALAALALVRVLVGPHALWHAAWLAALVIAVPARWARRGLGRFARLWVPLSDAELERAVATPATPSHGGRPGSGGSRPGTAPRAVGDNELDVLAAHCCGFRARRTAAVCALSGAAVAAVAIAAFLFFWMVTATASITPPPPAATGTDAQAGAASSTSRVAARMLAHMGILAPDGRAGSPATMAGALVTLALGLPLLAAGAGWVRGALLGLPVCLRIGVVGCGPGALRLVVGEPLPSDVVPGVPACLACGEGRPHSRFAPVPGTCVGRCTPMVDAAARVGGCRAPGASHCTLRPNPTRETVVILLGVPRDAAHNLACLLSPASWYAAAVTAKVAAEAALAEATAGPPVSSTDTGIATAAAAAGVADSPRGGTPNPLDDAPSPATAPPV